MEKCILNRSWKFRFGENPGDETRTRFDDYDPIALPHSFGIPYYGSSGMYVGYGCYSRELEAEPPAGGKVLLEFGAVFQVAQVYLNGHPAGEHRGGYTAFCVDITPYLKPGRNILFVRVNNLWNPVIAPRAGEHTFNGGIYRDVYRITYPHSRIGWYGLGITGRKNGEGFDVSVTADTENCLGRTMEVTLLDREGRTAARRRVPVTGDRVQTDFFLEHPHLWDVDDPYLYRAEVRVGEDSLSDHFGLRTVEWTRDQGFFLNGRHLLLDGANVHQDHGGWGDAVTHSGIRRDVTMIKECGFNFIRGSHYPHHNEFARECDRQGILFWSENACWGAGGALGKNWFSGAVPEDPEQQKQFEQSLRQQLAEMIRTNRNSPSIICWSMGNECFFVSPEAVEDTRAMLKRMVEYCHSLDPTRLAALGGVQRRDFDTIGDVVGYNGDGATLFKNPTKPNMVSEYGSVSAVRPGKFDLYESPGSDEYYPWRAGRCIWCGFHHGSIHSIGELGIIDLYRLPLRAYYCHRQRLRGLPPPPFSVEGTATHLEITATDRVISGDGTQDTMLVVRALDDRGNRIASGFDITLTVLSGSLMLPTGKTMRFSPELNNSYDGMCAIEVRGYFGGTGVVEASCPGLRSHRISITVDCEEPYQGQDLVYTPAQISQQSAEAYADLMQDRPCSVSSEAVEGSRLCLTSECDIPFWEPAAEDPKPWLMMDMERRSADLKIRITRGPCREQRVTVYTSEDRDTWFPVCDSSIGTEFRVTRRTRYIRIEPKPGCTLASVQVLGR